MPTINFRLYFFLVIDKERLKKESRELTTYKLKFHNTDLVGEKFVG